MGGRPSGGRQGCSVQLADVEGDVHQGPFSARPFQAPL